MLTGERVSLRAIERDDLPNYIQWLNDPAVLAFFGPYLPVSLEQETQWYERMLKDSAQCNFAIEFEGQHPAFAVKRRVTWPSQTE